jgi:hypothetical protein
MGEQSDTRDSPYCNVFRFQCASGLFDGPCLGIVFSLVKSLLCRSSGGEQAVRSCAGEVRGLRSVADQDRTVVVVAVARVSGCRSGLWSIEFWSRTVTRASSFTEGSLLRLTSIAVTGGVPIGIQSFRSERFVLVTTRFTQTDAAPLGAGSVFESSYVYVGNSPLVCIDPAVRAVRKPSSTWTTNDAAGNPITNMRTNRSVVSVVGVSTMSPHGCEDLWTKILEGRCSPG